MSKAVPRYLPRDPAMFRQILVVRQGLDVPCSAPDKNKDVRRKVVGIRLPCRCSATCADSESRHGSAGSAFPSYACRLDPEEISANSPDLRGGSLPR